MSLTAKDFTQLLNEVKKAKKCADNILDFVDLMNNSKENITGDITSTGEKIKDLGLEAHKLIDEIDSLIYEDLNKIPVNDDEVKEAAEKFLLYQDKEQILIWSVQQKANHPVDSYWWKYWDGIHNYMRDRSE